MILWSVILFHYFSFAGPLDSLMANSTAQNDPLASMIQLLPANQKRGIEEYLTITGLSVDRNSSTGIVQYNEQLLNSNSCFKKLASQFYADIITSTGPQTMRSLNRMNEGSGVVLTPLNTTFNGSGLQPGFLWEKALKYSDNDPNLAMQLIGLCGHDDMNQLQAVQFEASQDFQLTQRSGAQANQATQQMRLWVDQSCTGYKEYSNEMYEACVANSNATIRAGFDVSQPFGCPIATSPMYWPGALGTQADISPQLRADIARVQAPNKGASALPAKYYHVMGSAYTACHLVRRGIPQALTERIVKGAINAYRAGRICNDYHASEAGSAQFLEKNVEAVKTDVIHFQKNQMQCHQGTEHPSFCWVEEQFAEAVDVNMTDEILTAKILARKAKAVLFNQFEKSPQFSASQSCNGNQLTQSVREFLTEFSKNRQSCLVPADATTCEQAKQLAATWEIDFRWSEEQHMAGLRFAQEHCQLLSANEDPVKKACEVSALAGGDSQPTVEQ